MSQHHRGNWTAADSKKWRARIAASLPAPCSICGRDVEPGSLWDVDHLEGVLAGNDPSNLGPAHRSCNRRQGGKAGAAVTNAGRKKKSGVLPW